MNILFYTPFNLRSRDTESLMEAFVKQGHRVFLLTQAKEGIYQESCRWLGVEVSNYVIEKKNSFVYFLKHAAYLAGFCRKNKIDVVYAHLETAGLPAVMAQYFIRAKVFACRHVIDEAYLFNSRRFVIMTKIVYRLAKDIIVVSNHCKEFMVTREKIDPKKIRVIFLAYNFKLYKEPNPEEVSNIKSRFPSQLVLIVACRLVAPKRTELAINVTKRLVEKGIQAKLIVLGSGPDFEKIKNYIAATQASGYVFMEGFKLNVMDYLAAGDLLIHPSVSDSSSVIIKEAGRNRKVVVACAGIGDVDDYLTHNKTAILVSTRDTENEMLQAIHDLYHQKQKMTDMGNSLHDLITERFSIHSILPVYDEIHRQILKQRS